MDAKIFCNPQKISLALAAKGIWLKLRLAFIDPIYLE